VISFLAIILVTDPFGRSEGPHLEGALHPALEGRREDHLPTTFRSKLIGVSLCLPDVATTAAESESKKHDRRGVRLSISGDNATYQRSSLDSTDPHHPITMPSDHCRLVSRPCLLVMS
jgi:hypothetical protein